MLKHVLTQALRIGDRLMLYNMEMVLNEKSSRMVMQIDPMIDCRKPRPMKHKSRKIYHYQSKVFVCVFNLLLFRQVVHLWLIALLILGALKLDMARV